MSLTPDSAFEVSRPWGKFLQFTKDNPSTVKILTVSAGEAFSLQLHHKREETWFVLKGDGVIEINGESFPITPNSKFLIPKEATHRITAGENDVQVLEISTGEFDEEDIVRLEDRYGRVKNE